MSDPVPCRDRIVAAVFARLGQLTAVPGVLFEQDREEDLAEHEFPRGVLRDGGQQPFWIYTGQDDFTLALEIDLYARSRAQLGLMRAMVTADLGADFTLGGLVRHFRLDEESAPQILAFEHMPRDFRGTTLRWLADYATRENDPFNFAG